MQCMLPLTPDQVTNNLSESVASACKSATDRGPLCRTSLHTHVSYILTVTVVQPECKLSCVDPIYQCPNQELSPKDLTAEEVAHVS